MQARQQNHYKRRKSAQHVYSGRGSVPPLAVYTPGKPRSRKRLQRITTGNGAPASKALELTRKQGWLRRWGSSAISVYLAFLLVAGTVTKTPAEETPPSPAAENFYKASGSVRASFFGGFYPNKESDAYGTLDNDLCIKGPGWRVDLSVPSEPYAGPPRSKGYRTHIFQALGTFDLTPRLHLMAGIFPPFGRSDATPLMGFNADPIGNYDLFRSKSPLFGNVLGGQAGGGLGFDVNKWASIAGRVTNGIAVYLGAPGGIDKQPTGSFQLNVKPRPWISGTMEYAHGWSLADDRLAFSLNLKQEFHGLVFQIYGADIINFGLPGVKNSFHLATGVGGAIDPQTLWRVGAGIMQNKLTVKDAPLYGYAFIGASRKLTDRFLLDVTFTCIRNTEGLNSYSIGPSLTYCF